LLFISRDPLENKRPKKCRMQQERNCSLVIRCHETTLFPKFLVFISGHCTLVFIHEVGNCRAWQSSCSFIINRYPFQFFLNSSFVKFSNLYSEKICNCIQVVFQALGLPLQANVNPVQIAQMHANVKALVMFLVSRIKYFDCR